METIAALIFVQSFVWFALLSRKRPKTIKWMGISFLILGFVYLLHYSTMEFGIQVPNSLIFSLLILLIFLSSFYQYITLINPSNSYYAGSAILFLSGIAVLLQNLLFFSDILSSLYLAGLLGFISVSLDAYIFFRKLRGKGYTARSQFFKLFRVNALLLTDKILGLSFCLFLIIDLKRRLSLHWPSLIFESIIAVALFITGYRGVLLSFKNDIDPKEVKKILANSDLSKEIIRIMEEEKLYLDCELTLGRMAKILELNENELSAILHNEMNTSFYELVNRYRVATVKEKLLKPESRQFTIMASAYESGFNSKSTFYRIFKDYTGMNPRDFIERG